MHLTPNEWQQSKVKSVPMKENRTVCSLAIQELEKLSEMARGENLDAVSMKLAIELLGRLALGVKVLPRISFWVLAGFHSLNDLVLD